MVNETQERKQRATLLEKEQEMTFRKSVEATPPWGLGASELTEWLDREWLGSDTPDCPITKANPDL